MQAALCEDLAHAERPVGPTGETGETGEAEWGALERALRERVLEPTALYNAAVRLGRDDACLRVLRNAGFGDAETVRRHWGRLLDEVLRGAATRKWVPRGAVTRRLDTLQARLVALAREFNEPRGAAAFFPVAFLVRRCEEVALAAGKSGDALGDWVVRCFADCGVDFEQLVHVTRDVAEAGVQSRWIVNAIWVFAK